jgi:hypothetical protein
MTLQLTRQWIRDCTREHESCRPYLNARRSSCFMPTRILQYNGRSGKMREHLRVRLYIPKAGEHKEYAALRYCWGGDQPLRNYKRILEPEDLRHRKFKGSIRGTVCLEDSAMEREASLELLVLLVLTTGSVLGRFSVVTEPVSCSSWGSVAN